MAQTRRRFLRNTGVGLLTFYVSGCEVEMTPQEAREREIAYGVLTESEASTLDALGEILLPGDPERRTMARRTETGIPIDEGNWKPLVELAKSLGVAAPTNEGG